MSPNLGPLTSKDRRKTWKVFLEPSERGHPCGSHPGVKLVASRARRELIPAVFSSTDQGPSLRVPRQSLQCYPHSLEVIAKLLSLSEGKEQASCPTFILHFNPAPSSCGLSPLLICFTHCWSNHTEPGSSRGHL